MQLSYIWLRRMESNHRPLAYEANVLPLHYFAYVWSAWLDLNQQPPDSKSGRLTRLTLHAEKSLTTYVYWSKVLSRLDY